MKRVSIALTSVMITTLTACTGDLSIAEAQRQLRVANNPAAMTRIARAAEIAGDPATAEAFYQRAADLRPGDAAGSIDVARSLVEQGRNGEAVACLQRAHTLRPGDTLVAATLGRLLVALRRPQEALNAFEDGLRADPRSTSLMIGRGVALDAMDEHSAAQESYRSALAIAPHNVAAQNNLALSLTLSGHPDQAAAMLRALSLASDPADMATVKSNLALASGSPALRSQVAGPGRFTSNDVLFPTLGTHGGGGGAGTTGVATATGAPPP